jgi:hypothetical protein
MWQVVQLAKRGLRMSWNAGGAPPITDCVAMFE